jgi:nucleoside-diphosphate-sugar epimerase
MISSFRAYGNIKTKNAWVKRPILGIEDLTNGIAAILQTKIKRPGQYNMSSFNTTVSEAAAIVSLKTGCKIIKMQDDNNFYDFQIDSSKFERTFDFQFIDTIESILDTLLNSDTSKFNPRNNDEAFNAYE